MKKIFLLMLFLGITAHAFSQQTTSAAPFVKADYLKKSKNQKFIAWTFLGAGAMVAVIRGLSATGLDFGSLHKSPSPGIPLTISAVLMAGSIPFFIASSRNKKRANSLSVFLKSEKQESVRQGSLVNKNYPALGIKISL